MDSDSNQLQELVSAIDAAFAGLPIPAGRSMFGPLHPKDRAAATTFRQGVAGKAWQDLPPDLIAENWYWFSGLTPVAYRYYLPSLLKSGLIGFERVRDSMYHVVCALTPSFHALYYQGADRAFEAQQSHFTPDQYQAVAAVLGFVFGESSGRYRHHAAQALRWGWNRMDTPELRAAMEYYRRLHSFIYPEPEDREIAELCSEIRAAFAETPYPGDDALCGSEQGDEPAEYAMELRGVAWNRAHPELLARCYAALSFLTDAGLRYFLPAYLLADLHGCESNANPVFQLTHGLCESIFDRMGTREFPSVNPDPAVLQAMGISSEQLRELIESDQARRRETDWDAYSRSRFTQFTRSERRAIVHYLEFRARDPFQAEGIHQALERYWRRGGTE